MRNILAVLFFAAVGLLLVKFLSSRASQRRTPSSEPPETSAEVGRTLRLKMLTTPPAQLGVTPTTEFPRVYGVLMDWPIDDQTATVFSASSGAASLYTTSTFGIIGGEGHEAVRSAAMKFVRAADRYLDAAQSTTEYPYPNAHRVRFYFLTFEGVRLIDTDLASVSNNTGKYTELFGLGQAVLTELRLVTQKRSK